MRLAVLLQLAISNMGLSFSTISNRLWRHSFFRPPKATVKQIPSCNVPVPQLCAQLKAAWPASLPRDSWYISILATLTSVNSLDSLPALFSHVLAGSAGLAEQRRVSGRLKDVLFKQVTLIGIVRPLMALTALAAVEKEMGIPVPDVDEQKLTSRYIGRDDRLGRMEMQSIGRQHLDKLYERNLEGIMQTWGAHRADIEWMEERIIYGMFLSDFNDQSTQEDSSAPLNAVEVSLVTLASIMAQDVGGGPPRWHVRGIMRLGISVEDTEQVCNSVKQVAKWAGVQDTEQWIRASDVAPEV